MGEAASAQVADRSEARSGDAALPDIAAFVSRNMALLHDPRLSIGTWHNDKENSTYLDVVVVLPSRAEAESLGQQYDQQAIFDLFEKKEIDTGGRGLARPQSIPIDKRLPFPLRKRKTP